MVFLLDWYFLIPGIIEQTFNPDPELTIPMGMSTKEAKAETATHSVTAKASASDSI